MKIEILSSHLAKTLSKISKVIPSKSNTFQILDTFLFDISNKQLTITASDNYSTLVTLTEVKTDFNASIAVPMRILELLKTIPEQSITLEIKEKTKLIEISTRSGLFDMPYLDGDLYPSVPQIEETNSFSLPHDTLMSAIKNTLFATSNDELKPASTGVYFDFKNDGLSVVATDTHKFSLEKHPSVKNDELTSILVHKKPLSLLADLFDNQNYDVKISYSNEAVSFKSGSNILYSKLIDTKFPAYETVLNVKGDQSVIIDRGLFLNSIKRAQIFTDRTLGVVVLTFENNTLNIVGEDANSKTKSEESIPCNTTEGLNISLKMNSKMLEELCEIMDSEEIEMIINQEANRPLFFHRIVKEKRDEDRFFLLMPLKFD